jgi:putative transposase
MSNYRRIRVAGGTFFFTVVTFRRQPFLCTDLARAHLREVFRETRGTHPFTIEAICLLPDHLHCIWTLPENDDNNAERWSKIKGCFTRNYTAAGGQVDEPHALRRQRGEAGMWQRRFYEHWVRGEEDLRRHIDYIHFIPVKHGLVSRPSEWRWSSFGRYLRQGVYAAGWGETKAPLTCDGLACEYSEPI